MFISNTHRYSRYLISSKGNMIGKKMTLFIPVRPSRRSSNEDEDE